MGKLEFSPMETATVTCPKCGKVFYTVKQNEEVCDFKAIANFIDGDTPFHEYFGIGNKWTEYSSTVGVYECRYCESEFLKSNCVSRPSMTPQNSLYRMDLKLVKVKSFTV